MHSIKCAQALACTICSSLYLIPRISHSSQDDPYNIHFQVCLDSMRYSSAFTNVGIKPDPSQTVESSTTMIVIVHNRFLLWVDRFINDPLGHWKSFLIFTLLAELVLFCILAAIHEFREHCTNWVACQYVI